MKLLSTDDHLIEKPNLWTDRLPRRWQEMGPHIVEEPQADGQPPNQVWHYEGNRFPSIGLNAVAGKLPEQYGFEPVRFDDMLPGCYDPVERITDMDIDGVWGAMCFPSFPGVAGRVFTRAADKELAAACVAAYNDFVLDEWCPTAPDRFIPAVLVPMWDPDAAAKEARRTHAKGARAICFTENPVPLGLPSFHTDHWDGFFSTVEELDMPLACHFGSSSSAPITAPDAPMAVMIALFGTNSMDAAADLVFSPVFHRHPNLKFSLAEGGIGWMPYLIERCDQVWEKHRFYQNVNQYVRPSELFRKHIFGCFIDDVHGLENRYRIGIENITWECDYPHSDSAWPHSRKRAADVFRDIPDDEVHRIVELNTRRLYNFADTCVPITAG
jgi:predicted TIM-barrel fold metal-dependent hydrolase